MFLLPGIIRIEKVGILDVLKWNTAGYGVEEFRMDSSLQGSQ